MSSRVSRTGTPMNPPGTPLNVYGRDRPQRGLSNTPFDVGQYYAQSTVAEEVPQDRRDWYAPVTRWEKRWTNPRGTKTGTTAMVATLGPRPGVLPKPSPYEAKIFKYVKVPSKRPVSFDDDEDTYVMEDSQVQSVVDEEDTNVEQDVEGALEDAVTESNKEDDGLAEDSSDAVETVEALQQQETADNQDEMEQLEANASIVEENIEMLGPGNMASPKDVEEALSHPMSMGLPHEHIHKARTPKPDNEQATEVSPTVASPTTTETAPSDILSVPVAAGNVISPTEALEQISEEEEKPENEDENSVPSAQISNTNAPTEQ
ncbi:hypothetical protein BC832DRAFT_592988 [Gaertneriomyces semiglobifer]|nr:hypothetical protein BC832DRAFT_592988 [Gaertneriomyces semiglobifer]